MRSRPHRLRWRAFVCAAASGAIWAGVAACAEGRSSSPVELTASYTGDALYNLSGGARAGAMYEGRLAAVVEADLQQAFGWSGARGQLSVQAIHGTGLSGDRVGNLSRVSALQAMPTVRLYDLWIQQRLGAHGSLRVGQFTAGEFVVAPSAALFVNSTFGWPTSFAADLPSGGPADPLPAPGVRLELEPARLTRLRAAVFAGDPAGAGGGDPQSRDRFGFNSFRLTGGVFVIAELEREVGPVSLKLGGWRHSGRFEDRRLETDRTGNSAVYLVVDGKLWADAEGRRVLHGFARASWSPPDRNQIDRYAELGLSLSGPFAARPDDVAGLAVSLAHVTPSAQIRPAPGRETVIEATYQLQLRQGLSVQPDLQLVLRPNGGAIQPGAQPLPDAVVAGFRTAVKF